MDTIEWLKNILEQLENFTITESLGKCKNTFDLLCIVNYLLETIIDNCRYELETEKQKKDFEELIKIKDNILLIKNNNV